MAAVRAPKVSYCNPCKGRLQHLQQTLPRNLAVERDNPDVEFVMLDYDCPSGTAEWVKQTFPEEIASGRIRCARHKPAPYFKMAHAKNMAHRLGTGDILCNLDTDNFTAPKLLALADRAVLREPA